MPRDEAEAMTHRGRVLPVKPDDPTGEHAVVDEVSEEGGGDRKAAWKMHVDAGSGTPYWHNADTNETTWQRPGSEINLI